MEASEIVFRGKRVDNGEIIEGNLIEVGDDFYIYPDTSFWTDSWRNWCKVQAAQVHPDSIETVQKLYTQEEVNQLLQNKEREIEEDDAETRLKQWQRGNK